MRSSSTPVPELTCLSDPPVSTVMRWLLLQAPFPAVPQELWEHVGFTPEERTLPPDEALVSLQQRLKEQDEQRKELVKKAVNACYVCCAYIARNLSSHVTWLWSVALACCAVRGVRSHQPPAC